MSIPEQEPVAIVGAGFAGSVAALSLHARGIAVRVIDQASASAPLFRAEKLEPEQADALRSLDLLQTVLPCCTPIREIAAWRDGRLERHRQVRQYAMRYQDLVNLLRREVQTRVGIEVARVTAITARDDGCHLQLADGSSKHFRLCILATGSATAASRAGLVAATDEHLTSLNFGFDIRPLGARDVPLAFNHHSRHPHRDGLHYATFFPLGDIVRVNVFTAWAADDARVRAFVADPRATLLALLPRLREFYGDWQCVSRVQTAQTRFHRLAGAPSPALLALGEAYQSVSPATGMGLSRCLTDVRALLRHAASWPASGVISAAQIAAFHADPEKVAMDEQARTAWQWFHDSVHGRSLRWRIKRGPVGAALRWLSHAHGRARPREVMQ